jgi:hypothetical protein
MQWLGMRMEPIKLSTAFLLWQSRNPPTRTRRPPQDTLNSPDIFKAKGIACCDEYTGAGNSKAENTSNRGFANRNFAQAFVAHTTERFYLRRI